MSSQIRYFTFYWLPILIYCTLIFIQSSYPSIEDVPSFEHMDKLLHFVAYGLLGILFFRAYVTEPITIKPRLSSLLGILSATLYGASDEIHQYFVPRRSADSIDLLADILGSITGVVLYLIIMKKRQKAKLPHSIR